MNNVAFSPLEPVVARMTANLLLIDDNAVQAATRQTILRRAGYFVIAALNPARALEQLLDHEYPAPIQLVITDHLMPGMSGSEFVRRLRGTHPAVPVLVMTKSGISHDVVPYFMERFEDAYLAQIQSFIDAVLHGREAVVSGADAIEAIRVSLAATLSYREQRPVQMDSYKS